MYQLLMNSIGSLIFNDVPIYWFIYDCVTSCVGGVVQRSLTSYAGGISACSLHA